MVNVPIFHYIEFIYVRVRLAYLREIRKFVTKTTYTMQAIEIFKVSYSFNIMKYHSTN